MIDQIDLNPNHLATVKAILAEHVPECEVRAFGSRVTWTAKDYSDLDLAVVGEGPVDWRTLGRLKEAFEESDLPMRVDVLDWHAISDSFRDVIERGYVIVQDRVSGRGLTVTPGKWSETTFSQAVQINPTVRLRRGSVYPFVNMASVNAGSRSVNSTEEREFKGSGSRFQSGDTLMARITPCLENGKIARYRAIGDKQEAHGSTEFIAIRGRPGVTDDDFAYYLTQWKEVRNYAIGQMTGTSGRQRVPVDCLDHLEILLPPLTDQQVIAHVLGTLDDRIELNRRMNETLEEMARALFKSWFVDFDPVRAKTDGRWRRGESLPGLPADLYDLFPNRLVDSELGEIPEGWEVGVLDDMIELLSGGTPRTSVADYWNGDVPWYTAKDAPNLSDVYVLETERTITQAGIENSAASLLPAGTTIITARGTVGRLACLGVPMTMNQTCYGVRGTDGYPDLFTYWNVRTAVDELQQRTHGTIFDTITRQTFKLVETVLVPTDLADAFESMVGSLMGCILENLNESRALAVQQNALLPRLVSGQVRLQPTGVH